LAAIQGFARPLHRDLHAKFIDRYFEVIRSIYEERSYEDSSNILDLLFPTYAASAETLAKTDAWLTGVGKDGHPTLRRHILEAKDALERALRVQAVDR